MRSMQEIDTLPPSTGFLSLSIRRIFAGRTLQKSRLNARQSRINFSRLICMRGCIQEFIAPRVG